MRQLTHERSALCWWLEQGYCQWWWPQCTAGCHRSVRGFHSSGCSKAPSPLFHWDRPCHTTLSSTLWLAMKERHRDGWEAAAPKSHSKQVFYAEEQWKRRWNALWISSLTLCMYNVLSIYLLHHSTGEGSWNEHDNHYTFCQTGPGFCRRIHQSGHFWKTKNRETHTENYPVDAFKCFSAILVIQ